MTDIERLDYVRTRSGRRYCVNGFLSGGQVAELTPAPLPHEDGPKRTVYVHVDRLTREPGCVLTFKGWDDGIDWHECATHEADVIGHHVPCEHGTFVEHPTADCEHPGPTGGEDARDMGAADYSPRAALDECLDLWGSGAWDDSNAVHNLREVMLHVQQLGDAHDHVTDVPDPRDDALDRIAELIGEMPVHDAGRDGCVCNLCIARRALIRILRETGRQA